MFTKNLAGPEHYKNAAKLCGHDKDYNTAQDGESHEQERVSGVTMCSLLEKSNISRCKILGNQDKCA